MAIDKITTPGVTDDSVTLAKMAPGTDGNIISYDASGNPVAVATGNDGQVLTSAGAGAPPVFETPASDSQAIVYAQSNSGTSCADNTVTKIELANDILDTSSLMASSRFTVTSDYQGKYFVLFQLSFNIAATGKRISASIRKNNSEIQYADIYTSNSNNHTAMTRTSIVVNLTTNDYLEFFGKQVSGGTVTSNSGTATNVQIFKIN